MQRPFKPASKARSGPAFLWALMRQAGAGGFTVTQLEKETTSTARSTVKSYVLALIAQGYIERLDLQPRQKSGAFGRRRYRVIRDSRTAPVQRRDDYANERGRARQQLWNGMRAMRSFAIGELARVCSTDDVAVSFANARAYVAALMRAGMVIALRPYAKGGGKGVGSARGASAGLYSLRPAANTGPLPAKVMRDGVFDPNTETLMRFPNEERIAA